MSKKIYKYTLPYTPGHEDIEMPDRARILSVGAQTNGMVPVLWAMCDTEKPICKRRVLIEYTGVPLSKDLLASRTEYVGTVALTADSYGTPLVLHVFDFGYIDDDAERKTST